jgi:hypothetical protein
MTTVDTPRSTCECGYVVDAATGVRDGTVPTEGMISLCLRCGRVKQFDAELRLVPVDEAALDEWTRGEIRRTRAAIKRLWRGASS